MDKETQRASPSANSYGMRGFLGFSKETFFLKRCKLYAEQNALNERI